MMSSMSPASKLCTHEYTSMRAISFRRGRLPCCVPIAPAPLSLVCAVPWVLQPSTSPDASTAVLLGHHV
eukprot:6491320-Amphidinium_carterae.1